MINTFHGIYLSAAQWLMWLHAACIYRMRTTTGHDLYVFVARWRLRNALTHSAVFLESQACWCSASRTTRLKIIFSVISSISAQTLRKTHTHTYAHILWSTVAIVTSAGAPWSYKATGAIVKSHVWSQMAKWRCNQEQPSSLCDGSSPMVKNGGKKSLTIYVSAFNSPSIMKADIPEITDKLWECCSSKWTEQRVGVSTPAESDLYWMSLFICFHIF